MFDMTAEQAAEPTWHPRLARTVDLRAGVATFFIPGLILFLQQALLGLFDLWRSEPWHNVFLFSLWFCLFGAILSGHLLLARRGQSIGLALMRLRWCTPDGRPAIRRLLGGFQLWCAAGPSLYFTLLLALALLLSHGPSWDAYGMWFPYALGTALVVGAVVAMVLTRRTPGHLVADPFPMTPRAMHLCRLAEWGVLGLGTAVAGLSAAVVGVPPVPWAQFLAGCIAASCSVVAVFSIAKALYHASRGK